MNEMKAEKALYLSDGTKLSESHAYELSGNRLIVYVYDPSVSFVDAFRLFSDQSKTKKITYKYSESETIFEGYTKPISLSDDGTLINVILQKEKDGDIDGSH